MTGRRVQVGRQFVQLGKALTLMPVMDLINRAPRAAQTH
jgi:hypothetical protein